MERIRKIVLLFFINLVLSANLYSQKNTFEKANIQIQYSGNSKLKNGEVKINLPAKLKEDLEGISFDVLLTPYNNWSGLFVTDIDETGFVVKSQNGDLNVNFYWFIVTRVSERH